MKRGPSLPVDRILPVVGRVHFRTGTHVPAVKRKWDRMLTELAENYRFDLLRDIRDSRKRRGLIFDYWQNHALDRLPSGKAADPLISAMEAWRLVHVCGPERRQQMKYDIGHLRKQAAKDATCADLPAILEGLKETAWARKHHRAFNQVKSTAMAFAKTFKRSSVIYRETAAVEPFPRSRKKKGRPMVVDRLRELFPDPDGDTVDEIAWSMALYGYGRKELWGKWSIKPDRVHIAGTKREGRDREVPKLSRLPVRPRMHHRTFENKVRERTRDHVVYDLRRSYANLMEAAKIPRTRRRLYMGHGARDILDLYEEHEVAEFLKSDAATLNAYITQKS